MLVIFLLREIARRIKLTIHDHNAIARIGSDEFGIIVEHVPHSGAHRMALDILKMFEVPIIFQGRPIYATVSIGMSLYPDNASEAQTLMSFADLAMYQAKEQGRNNFHYFTESLNNEASQWVSIENGLRQALDYDELYLVYQPQINFKKRSVEGVEALIRWQQPAKGLILPNAFIPVAEQSGQIL